jgi:hypothetical protein
MVRPECALYVYSVCRSLFLATADEGGTISITNFSLQHPESIPPPSILRLYPSTHTIIRQLPSIISS